MCVFSRFSGKLGVWCSSLVLPCSKHVHSSSLWSVGRGLRWFRSNISCSHREINAGFIIWITHDLLFPEQWLFFRFKLHKKHQILVHKSDFLGQKGCCCSVFSPVLSVSAETAQVWSVLPLGKQTDDLYLYCGVEEAGRHVSFPLCSVASHGACLEISKESGRTHQPAESLAASQTGQQSNYCPQTVTATCNIHCKDVFAAITHSRVGASILAADWDVWPTSAGVKLFSFFGTYPWHTFSYLSSQSCLLVWSLHPNSCFVIFNISEWSVMRVKCCFWKLRTDDIDHTWVFLQMSQ